MFLSTCMIDSSYQLYSTLLIIHIKIVNHISSLVLVLVHFTPSEFCSTVPSHLAMLLVDGVWEVAPSACHTFTIFVSFDVFDSHHSLLHLHPSFLHIHHPRSSYTSSTPCCLPLISHSGTVAAHIASSLFPRPNKLRVRLFFALTNLQPLFIFSGILERSLLNTSY
jgi:hypothetical protein